MPDAHDPLEQIRRLAPLDREHLMASWSDSDAKPALLQEILTMPPTAVEQPTSTGPAAPTRPRRRIGWRLAAVAAAALAVVAVGLPIAGRFVGSAAIATPDLTVPVDTEPGPAADELQRMGELAALSPHPEGVHSASMGFALHTAVSQGQADSEFLVSTHHSWVGDDGSRVLCDGPRQTVEVALAATIRLVDTPPPCEQVRRYAPGELEATVPSAPPTGDPTSVRAQLADDPERDDISEVVTPFLDARRHRFLTPAETRTLLDTLATFDQVGDYGTVEDLAGRQVHTFGWVTDDSGLPTRHLLMLDPDTGHVLAHEQALTVDAGKLDVPVPTVIAYSAWFESTAPMP